MLFITMNALYIFVYWGKTESSFHGQKDTKAKKWKEDLCRSGALRHIDIIKVNLNITLVISSKSL